MYPQRLKAGIPRWSGRVSPGRVIAGSAGLAASAAVAGLVAGTGYGLCVLLAVFLLVVVGLGVASWRRSLEWMLYYLPFSGLLPLALYPSQGAGTELKDIAFVGPAYVGALLLLLRRRERLAVPRAPVLLLGAMACLVFVQAVNPALAKPLVGAIGVKVWLFYIPLIALGYHMYTEKRDLARLLKWMTILATIPCALGLVEAALVYGGRSAFVYHLYGAAAAATTEQFTTFQFGGASLTRISSIFTFTAQYWFFSTAAIAIAWAAWRGNRNDPTMRWLGPTAIAIATFASLTSGLRAAFIFTPLLLSLIAAFDGFDLRRLISGAAASAFAIIVVLYLLGIPFSPLANLTSGHASFILGFFGQGIRFGVHHALLGLGTGSDTAQARYAFSTVNYGTTFASLGGVWYESWYLKAFIELGVSGFVVFVCLCAALVRRSLQAHRAIVDVEARSMSAAVLALLVWTLLFSVKTALVDEDPLDVYLWLSIGLEWRLGDAALAATQATAFSRRENAHSRAGDSVLARTP
ncbi:MAG: hypothetical protein M3071_19145 [Actinomycetota bacterium]|nr:hypothetical protein [Actinomycetota bacterium]